MRRLSAVPTVLTIAVAIAATIGVARADTLIVINKSDATASLVDLDKDRVVATVPTGASPHEVAVSPDGRTALVTDYGSRKAGTTLTVIDIAKAERVQTIQLGRWRRPHGVEWLADGKHAAVTVEDSGAMIIVDVDAGTVTKNVPTMQRISHMVVVTPDDARAFVANIGSDSVTAIDLATGKRLAIIRTGRGAEGIDITPDGKQVWVTNRAENTVAVIDAETLKIVAKIPCADFPIRCKAMPDGAHVLVTNAKSDDVAVFDTKTLEEVRRIGFEVKADPDLRGRLFGNKFGDSSVPIGILIQDDGKRAFVAHAHGDVISTIDLETWKATGTLKAGREPDGLAYSAVKAKSE